jgi:hypothetical protein
MYVMPMRGGTVNAGGTAMYDLSFWLHALSPRGMMVAGLLAFNTIPSESKSKL